MNKIIEIARQEIGYTENPPNSNMTKYSEWFGLNGVPWCGIFVSWVYWKAGQSLGNVGFLRGFAGCQTAVNHYREEGKIITTPQPGCIVFFDWNGDGRYDHTGIFVGRTPEPLNRFFSIEGNTSHKNQSNGGQVMQRIRSFDNAIFVKP